MVDGGAGRADGGRQEARAAPVGTAVGSPWPSRTPQSRGRKGLGPRHFPSAPRLLVNAARCQTAAATRASASASWAGLSPEPLLCPNAQRSCRTRRGCLPAAQGAPAAPPPHTFPRMWRWGRISCRTGEAGGPKPSRGLIWAQRSEVQCLTTPRWLTPQTGLQRGLLPPQPAPPAPAHSLVLSSGNAHRVFPGPSTRPPGRGRPLGADRSAACSQGLLPHPPVGNSNNNASC